MFPSPNSVNNCYNPFDDDDHHHIKRSASDHQNPNHSRSDHPDPPFLLPFPPSFFDVDHLNQIPLQTQTPAEQKGKSQEKPRASTVAKSGPSTRRPQRNLGPIPRRKAGKKDRHSKICTAQGIRDRRMRLSLQTARKFFDLQDALGYDKASKTIEWLFTKSKKAIRELTKAHPHYFEDVSNSCSGGHEKSESYVVSDCEVVSGILMDEDVKESVIIASPSVMTRPNSRSESRERARARARCRTREKMMARVLESSGNNGIDKLGFSNCSMFEGVDQWSNLNSCSNSNNQERVSLYENLYNSLEQQFGDVGTIEKFLENSSSIVSCPNYSDYNYQRSVSGYVDQNNSLEGFLGNWDVLNSTERTNSTPSYGVASNQVSSGKNPSSITRAHHNITGFN